MKAIYCVDKNGAFGNDNDLVLKIQEDMNLFKFITRDSIVIMGYNTFMSLKKESGLAGRINIVMTREEKISNKDQVHFVLYDDIEKILDIIEQNQYRDVFVIGGIKTLKMFEPYINIRYKAQTNTIVENCDKWILKSSSLERVMMCQVSEKLASFRINGDVNLDMDDVNYNLVRTTILHDNNNLYKIIKEARNFEGYSFKISSAFKSLNITSIIDICFQTYKKFLMGVMDVYSDDDLKKSVKSYCWVYSTLMDSTDFFLMYVKKDLLGLLEQYKDSIGMSTGLHQMIIEELKNKCDLCKIGMLKTMSEYRVSKLLSTEKNVSTLKGEVS